ncbi:hypothetical protein [Mucilaginibacter sp.]|uniref:hypothetical protein n=1 Tax=Mucilaginibacter sp. TaxID=1882438 RepID=UPI002849F977|nr:hypothetical protein [Mucilaginibacter sp.]MDR3696037.1 hypothetical protein [Mucilaginibacter sp.]
MATLTVKIQNKKDLSVLREILDRFGLSYAVDTNEEYVFSEAEIASLVKTKQDFIDGKTTARDWTEIEEDLNRAYN